MTFFLNDDLSRRRFIETAARSLLGVSLLPGLQRLAAAAPSKAQGKRMIYLFMTGAMSQIDTFDPKPESDVQGPTKAISTKVSGVQFGEFLPKVAAAANHLAVVRSLNTPTGAHDPGQYLMRTNYRKIASTSHPGWGSWMHKMHGRIHDSLPASVLVGGGQGPGYLGAKYAPVPIGDPSKGLENTRSPAYVSDTMFDQRMQLSTRFDLSFRRKTVNNVEVNGYDELYRDAIGLLRSKDLAAFDISQEPENVSEAYGESKFGRGCLLARRLIEHDVRYVEVSHGSWDHHVGISEELPEKCGDLDQGLSALLADLHSRGLLEETLVVVATEFGRKPKMNQNAGRDHHPAAFSCALAGAGIQGGQVYGATDGDAFYPDDDPVNIEDFNATIGKALGLPIDEEITSPAGRPFTIAHGGKPIKKLVG